MRWFLTRLFILLFAAGAISPAPGAGRTISLDGDWIFVPDPAGSLKAADLASAAGIPIRVPSSWQAAFVDRRDYAGVAWYWRNITVEPSAAGNVLLLRCGAVDYRADVYVNGQKAGSHDGGYLPFEFDITSLVHPGENQIAVRVADPGGKIKQVEGIHYAEIPHGKQDWYVQTSGLWQSVELDTRPRLRLSYAHVSADAQGNFKIEVTRVTPPLDARFNPRIQVRAEILDPSGRVVWQDARDRGPSEGLSEFSGKLANPSPWSPSSPTLYTLRTSLGPGDTLTSVFGFRTFETREGKFYLNGKAVYLRAALDQAFYPDTVSTPPSLDYLRQEMRQAKALGLNMLRCHIQVPDPRYLEAADEEGVLVWYEIPNWDKLTADSASRGMETLRGMIERDWNHPSIVMVSIINESWGVDLKTAGERAWLKSAYQQAKKIVPGWLVDDNSACCDNFHLATDIADFHQYNAIPEHAGDFDRLVGDFATRPGWIFSPYGDAEPKGNEPLMLSEFGNWGLPRLHEPEPWWFSRDFNGRAITLPEGVEKRFSDYGHASLFADYNALADATQEAQFRALQYEIGSIRIRPAIQGYVITEFTDLNWESNGLLDMWRQPKTHGERLGKLQQDDLVIVRAEEHNYRVGEQAQAAVYFSHYSEMPLAGAQVAWELEGTELRGNFALPVVDSASSSQVGKIQFDVPPTIAPARYLLKVQVMAGGKPVSEDSLYFYFYPPKTPDLPPPVWFHDPRGRLRRLVNEMRARNYQSPSGRESLPVLISSAWDEQVKQTLRDGGIVILLGGQPMTLAPGLEVVPRSKDNLDGNWISSFSWIRKDHAPFRQIGFETLPGFEAQSVTPNTVVRGVPPGNFDDVLSGIFYGWIHSNVGTLVQAQYGKGKLLISTFSLGTTYGTDPYATYLLDALMNYAVSGFMPRYRIPLDATGANPAQ